ncbi:MAG: NeuD/PglB/VioB family sugar acetyltransferase [Verrucomicrobiae bacterium]|nr:NeuD/PglB/VioB family sugar acetyltransferase [Verrucomicrobiae bacterium]
MRAIIFGAGNHGRVVLDILRAQGREVIGWLDENRALWGTQVAGLTVLGGLDWLREHRSGDLGVIAGIGNTKARVAVSKAVESLGVPLINAIHPSAVIMPTATLGRGICVCAGAIIGTSAQIGDYALINTGSSIDHDSVLEEGAWVSPGVVTAGCVRIGRGAYVSTGAVLVAGVSVGAGAVVAAGAVVTNDVPPGVLVMGVPARKVKDVDESFNWTSLVSGLSRKPGQTKP